MVLGDRDALADFDGPFHFLLYPVADGLLVAVHAAAVHAEACHAHVAVAEHRAEHAHFHAELLHGFRDFVLLLNRAPFHAVVFQRAEALVVHELELVGERKALGASLELVQIRRELAVESLAAFREFCLGRRRRGSEYRCAHRRGERCFCKTSSVHLYMLVKRLFGYLRPYYHL